MRACSAVLWLTAVMLVGCGDSDPPITGGGDGSGVSTTGTGSGTTDTGVGTSDTSADTGTADTGDTTGTDTGFDTGGLDCGDCDDANECTKDACGQDGVCVHLPVKSPQCYPSLSIQSPERAVTMLYQEQVVVEGSAASPVGALGAVTINGGAVPTAADGSFNATLVYPTHGINVITAELEDAIDDVRVVQAYLMGEDFYPTLEGVTAAAQVPNGLQVFMGKPIWDDDNINDLDDVATFVHTILDNVDVTDFITNPVTTEGTEPGIGWCEWSVSINGVSYSVKSVDFAPADGGFTMNAELEDLVVKFYAEAPDFACPDAGGTAATDTVSIEVFVSVSMSNSVISVEVAEEDVLVEVGELEFDITEGVASAFDFLFNWFSGTITGFLKTAVKTTVVDQVAPLVSQLLEELSSYVQSFAIPPFLGGTQSVPVTVSVSPSSLKIDKKGAHVGLGISVTTPPGKSTKAAMGSIKRAGCFLDSELPLKLPTNTPLAMAVHDDMVNQGIFAAWWGGIMDVSVDQDIITLLVPDLPIEKLQVTVDPHLPPVITNCTENGVTQFQLGDLRVIASYDLEGKPATVEAFVSAIFEVELKVQAAENATIDIGFGVTKGVVLEFEVIDATGSAEGAKNLLELILKNVVRDLVVGSLSDGIFQNFPIPQFDLSSFIVGLPSETVLAFDPTELTRNGGYTVLTGGVIE